MYCTTCRCIFYVKFVSFFKEKAKQKRKTTASKTKSGKSSAAGSKRNSQTGRGIRTLPSLTESGDSKHSGQKQLTLLTRNRTGRGSNALLSTLTETNDSSLGETRGRVHHQRTLPNDLDRSVRVTRGRTSHDNQQSFLSSSLPVDLRGRVNDKNDEGKTKIVALLRSTVRLWCHEVSRVYGDRLTGSKDKIWMMKLIETCCKYCFCGSEIEDTADTAQQEVNRGVARRARPGKPSRGGGVTIVECGVHTPAMKLQAATLVSSGILYTVMTQLLPKAEQVELINFDELVIKGEDLTGLMFAKLPPPPSPPPPSTDQSTGDQVAGTPAVKHKMTTDYVEIGDGQVKDALNKVLDDCSNKRSPAIGLVVMNKDGMEHVIRLCRALVSTCAMYYL